MIVWGGVSNGGYSNTGGRYNPSTDSWTATSTTNAPISRYYHSAIWTGSEMIIWGGRCQRRPPQHWRQIQSEHGQLDCDQHDECACRALLPHGNLEWQ